MPAIVSECAPERVDDNVGTLSRCYADIPCFVYFYSTWCPDCTRSTPLVNDVFWNDKVNLCLLKVDVGERASYKDPANPLRTADGGWEIRCLPTLVWLGVGAKDAGHTTRLAERLEQCADPIAGKEMIELFVKECTASNGGAAAASAQPPTDAAGVAESKRSMASAGYGVALVVALVAGLLSYTGALS